MIDLTRVHSFWMIKAGHLAPFYGIASTRKALLEELEERKVRVPTWAKPVRVLVYEVSKSPDADRRKEHDHAEKPTRGAATGDRPVAAP